jgi:hypothetical protein
MKKKIAMLKEELEKVKKEEMEKALKVEIKELKHENDVDDDDDVEFLEEHEKSREEVAIEEDVDDVVEYVMDKYRQVPDAELHNR